MQSSCKSKRAVIATANVQYKDMPYQQISPVEDASCKTKMIRKRFHRLWLS